jgi:hypothetical protein
MEAVKTKFCKSCNLHKESTEFNFCSVFKDGLAFYCRLCSKAKLKQNYIKNGEKQKERKKLKRKLGLSKDLVACKVYYSKNKEKIIENKKTYYSKNREKIDKRKSEYLKNSVDARKKKIQYDKDYEKKRKETDNLFKLKKQIRVCITSALKGKGFLKKSKTNYILGCSHEEFIVHLGSKPDGDCHLDHICPNSQAQNEEELLKLQHYTNLRWLKAEDNLLKSDKKTLESEKMCRILLNREWIY